MTFFGNLLLLIALLIFVTLNTCDFARPAPGGDAAVGYAWGILILSGAFILVMTLATIVISTHGGFDWVSPTQSTRLWYVTIGLIVSLIAFGFTMVVRHEGGPMPMVWGLLSGFVPIIVPVMMLVAGFVLLNPSIRQAVPVVFIKWPVILLCAIGLVCTGSLLFGWVKQAAANAQMVAQYAKTADDENNKRIMTDIDSCDVSKNLVFLLVFTGGNQPDNIRSASIAKLKTHPDWQGELIRLLQTDWALEPFQFLAYNDVDDPKLFAEPVRLGVLNQARLIRETIRRASHPSHFYRGQFSWEVERLLMAVDRFKGNGVDYRPAVKELRKAFNEKSDFDKPEWICLKTIDKWLKQQ